MKCNNEIEKVGMFLASFDREFDNERKKDTR